MRAYYDRMCEKNYAVEGVTSPTVGQKEIENPIADKDISSSDLIMETSSEMRSERTDTSDYDEEEEDGDVMKPDGKFEIED